MAKTPTNWSLKIEDWENLSKLLQDRELSWSRVLFQSGAADAIPEEPGIYLVCARPIVPLGGVGSPRLETILYVGMSNSSIRSRFSSHLSERAKPAMKAARSAFVGHLNFFFAVVDDPGEYERCFYGVFGPVVNAIAPPRMRGRLGEARAL